MTDLTPSHAHAHRARRRQRGCCGNRTPVDDAGGHRRCASPGGGVLMARPAPKIITVHPGPYRCLREGCMRPAICGVGFSLSRRGVGLCQAHKSKESRS